MKQYLILLALVPSLVLAGGDPHHDPEPQPDPEPITIINKTINEYTTINQYSDNSSAVLAMAMAQHHFNYGTYAYQQSFSAAALDDKIAASTAMAHRRCKTCGLFSASISVTNVTSTVDEQQLGIGIGYTRSY